MAVRRPGSTAPKWLYLIALLLLATAGSRPPVRPRDLDIKEALGSLPTEVVDAHIQHLKHAMDLSMKHQYLPEDLPVHSVPLSLHIERLKHAVDGAAPPSSEIVSRLPLLPKLLSPDLRYLRGGYAYAFGHEIWDSGAGSSLPRSLPSAQGTSRSVSGSYENEGVTIFTLLLTFYLFVHAVNTGSLAWVLTTVFGYF